MERSRRKLRDLQTFFNPVFALVIAGTLWMVLSAEAGGQGTTASITGTITDTSGQSEADVDVTILNLETNASRTIRTSGSGYYTVTQLPPGHYQIKIAKQGFRTYQQDHITLVIGQVAEIDASLQVGSADQTITVTANAPVIQTEDSSVGLVIDSATIVNTPLNGRLSIVGLIGLAPGVQSAGTQDQVPNFGVTPAIGSGSRNAFGAVGFTLDGAINMDVGLERGEGEVPPQDGIAEFKVLTSSVPAEYAKAAQITVVSKSGTNAVHGMLLEFNRVAATAAKSYFASSLPKPKYIRNEFGGNFSGPVIIPKVYDGRDRSFFFFNFEEFRLKQAANVNSQQPTLLMRTGDFSEIGNVIDPLTGLAFPNRKIPQDRLNPVDLQLQNLLYPLPTTSGTGTNTFELVPYTSVATRYSLRVDHAITAKDQIRGTFLRAFYGPNPTPGVSSKAGGMAGQGEHNTNTIIGYTHIFSPSLLLDTTASYLHLPIFRTAQNHQVPFGTIIPGLAPILINGAPNITIKNVTTIAEAGSKNLDQTYQIRVVVTKSFPRHLVKIGATVLNNNFWQANSVGPARGSYAFTGTYSGIGYADFLLGYPLTVLKPTPSDFVQRNIHTQYGVFLQDDWKVTPRFTINAGLRYDLQWFEGSPYGNEALYIPALQKVVVFGDRYPTASNKIPAIPALLNLPITLSTQVGLPKHVWDYLGQDTNNFAPRFGFALQVRPKIVLRGAFGIYYNFIPGAYTGNSYSNVPFEATQTYTQPTGKPTFTMSAPFAATGTFTSNPGVYAQHATVTPYAEAYNLTAEQEFSRGLALRISYVGQHNLKQNNNGAANTAPDINLPPPAPGAVQARRFVQPFAAINVALDPIFHSVENSLQIGLHKQYTSGFTLNAEYQYTRVLGVENIQDPLHIGDSYGNVGGITPQVLQVSYSLPLPIGTRRRFFTGVSGITGSVLSGWQFSGIIMAQTGQPFSVTYATSVQGSVGGRANRVPGVPIYPADQTLAKWFNPSAFVAPPNFTYGSYGYNQLRGPKFQNWDISLSKTTEYRSVNLQLRVDAFNVFNHPNFAIPNATISNTNAGIITSQTGASRTLEAAAKLFF